jgi:hypothetical protein
MIEAKNDMQLVGEWLLTDEWQTTATREPKISAHLFGLCGKATEKTKATEVAGVTEEAGRRCIFLGRKVSAWALM